MYFINRIHDIGEVRKPGGKGKNTFCIILPHLVSITLFPSNKQLSDFHLQGSEAIAVMQ